MTLCPALHEATARWIAGDIDESTRDELQQLLAQALRGQENAREQLSDRMGAELDFGTAGLRGKLRAGPNGMNRAVVARATAGVAAWLTAQQHGSGPVVVGRDARHGSAALAEETAAVLDGAGFTVYEFDEPVPTPVLAFTVLTLNAVAGIQITASHNPAGDNGYKVYDSSGAQISMEAASDIESEISAAPAAASIARSAPDRKRRTGTGEVIGPYLDRVATLPRGKARDLRIVLTPLHGVGGELCVAALRRAGFDDVRVVHEQAQPDPDFPTVPFPNPEEPGACDRLLETAESARADLAIALDPDADRCAIGVARTADGSSMRMLTGDQLGVILGEHILSTLDRTVHRDPVVATSIVSSSQLASIASAHGARYTETLTGFKWLARAGDAQGTGLVYAYEEALGFCVDPEAVRDKDGIAAAVLAADVVATRKAAGSSLDGMLDELALAYGLHLTTQLSVTGNSPEAIAAIMRELRSNPPDMLAATPVATDDLLPKADVLRFHGGGIGLLIRPSGTEPKIKAYLEVTASPPGDEAGLETTRTFAASTLDGLMADTRTLLGL